MSDRVALPAIRPGLRDLRVVEEAFLHGLAHATSGLSKLVGREVRVADPDVLVVSLDEATRFVGTPERPMVGIYLGLTGSLNLHVVMLMEPANALHLVDLLMGQESGTAREVDATSESALGEVGNIMGSFFATVVGDLTNLTLWSTPPTVHVDMANALVDGLVALVSDATSHILVISTHFEQPGAAAHGSVGGIFLVLPEADGLDVLLRSLDGETE